MAETATAEKATKTDAPATEAPKTATSPNALAYTTREAKDKRTFWSRVGADFPHNDGKGSTIQLDVMPLDGEIIVRERVDPAAPKKDAEETAKEGGDAAKGARAPDLIAYSVRTSKGGRDFWTEIGIAYKHKDGRGKTLTLNAIPVNNRIVLRDRAERVTPEPTSADEA